MKDIEKILLIGIGILGLVLVISGFTMLLWFIITNI